MYVFLRMVEGLSNKCLFFNIVLMFERQRMGLALISAPSATKEKFSKRMKNFPVFSSNVLK